MSSSMFQTAATSQDGFRLPERFCVFESDSVHEAAEHFGGMLAPHSIAVQRPPLLPSAHYRTLMGETWINEIWYGSELYMEGMMKPEVYHIALVTSGRCEIKVGKETTKVGIGDIGIINPTHHFNIKMEQHFRNLVFQIDRKSLERSLSIQTDRALPDRIVFDKVPFSTSPQSASLQRFMIMCCQEMIESGLGISCSVVGDSYAKTLNLLLLNSLPHNLVEWMRHGQGTAAPYYVRRAEEFIRAHSTDALSLEDIAEAASVSIRSLHNGFRRFRDTTPMAYLKMVRLELSRQELAQAADNGISITQVAYHNGFNSMSKFSRDYQSSFGELPSETWRRGRSRH